MIADSLHRMVAHRASLRREEARAVMGEILEGKATDIQIAGLLVALSTKGETIEEIVGFAEAMRAAAAPLKPPPGLETNPAAIDPALDVSGTERDALVDTCGTGGDASGTFNISTATALTVAGAGVRVAKHGNRSVTSRCGSADVIEALGVNIDMPLKQATACLKQVGMTFLYAPAMHTAMKYVQRVRAELKVRTVFNLLGPLTNPAGASAQVVGVYSEALVEKLASVLRMLGIKRALVVHGSDGLDEITITGESKVAEIRAGQLLVYKIAPEHFGMERATLSEISGGDVAMNAAIIREILDGKNSARRDVVLLNAAAALVAAGKGETIGDTLPLAAKSLDSGAAKKKLEELVKFTRTH